MSIQPTDADGAEPTPRLPETADRSGAPATFATENERRLPNAMDCQNQVIAIQSPACRSARDGGGT